MFGSTTPVPTSPDLQVALTTNPITVTPTQADLRRRHRPQLRHRRLGGDHRRRRARRHDRRHRDRPGARGRCADHDHRERGHPGHRHLPAHGHGRPGEHGRRVERDQQRRPPARSSSPPDRSPRPRTCRSASRARRPRARRPRTSSRSPARPATPARPARPRRRSRSPWTAPPSAPRTSGRSPPARSRTCRSSIGTRAAGTYALVATVDPAEHGRRVEREQQHRHGVPRRHAPPDRRRLRPRRRPARDGVVDRVHVRRRRTRSTPTRTRYWEGAGGPTRARSR